jgi:hypothetical protein
MNHGQKDQQEGQDDQVSGTGHGSGFRGIALMILCCIPMIAIAALLVFGVLR